ncbi:PAS domain S-box protein [Mucilaginibacter sp. ZT4R22]|uniref:PAS domain S-box protein n=1 Tax=Mucilaginibacter pankratovii TaxID=2772110 RepID=A0ABR7WJX7_9SPHI|nr:PAS domain S-box protein [Mucilaginibacter pankratovii]MBD1362624.1 PAS domain S-box protein [Mucilaginibacter pankratovii]
MQFLVIPKLTIIFIRNFINDRDKRLQQENDALKQDKIVYEEIQHRFETVFELSRLGNKIIDPDLTILQVNQSLVTMLGYDKKEDLIATRIFDYAPDDRRDDWHFLQQKLWAHLTPSFSLETCLIRKDGSLIWCQVTSKLIPENGAKLSYTILEDVTEQPIPDGGRIQSYLSGRSFRKGICRPV